MKADRFWLAATTVLVLVAGAVHAQLPLAYFDNVPAEIAKLENPYPHSDAMAVKQGRRLYMNLCVDCHGRSGNGRGIAAEFLRAKPADFTARERMSQITDQQLYWVIKKGIAEVKMPAYGLLPEERWQLITYIRYLTEME